MALDKVIDSAKLDADLTSIADAIREKAGVSDSFVFPDGFIEAVSGISAGGGGENLYFGKMTPAEDTTILHIEHNIGVTPKFMFAMTVVSYSVADNSIRWGLYDQEGRVMGTSGKQWAIAIFGKTYSAGNLMYFASGSPSNARIDNTIFEMAYPSNSGYEQYVRSGKPFVWFAVV